MPPPPPAPPTLPDELVEEIFLRLPPDEPQWLVRASLCSKPWLGRLTAPRFHARYSEFHRAPPMLGFFRSGPRFVSAKDPLFVSTTKVPVCIPKPGKRGCPAYEARDCRHGRVLLGRTDMSPERLVVLHPITGRRRELYMPGYGYTCYGGAVLCTANGCDHRACHDGPYQVFFVGLENDSHAHDDGVIRDDDVASVWLFSSETGEFNESSSHFHPSDGDWAEACSGFLIEDDPYIKPTCPVLVEDALYFMLKYRDDDDRLGVLKYDMSSNCLSLIDAPLDVVDAFGATILVAMEDGSLGFAHLDGLTLNLWSRQMGCDGAGSWSECRVIDLKELLPVPNKTLRLIGSVEGADIIFMTTERGIHEINLKSLEWRKIWKEEEPFRYLFPYMRFYYPQGQ